MANKTGIATQKAWQVLLERHLGLSGGSAKSYGYMAEELGLPHSQRAALCQIVKGQREPSRRIIERMNKVYGTSLVFHPKAVMVDPLPCGHAPAGKRCAVCQPRTRQPDPVIRIKKLKRIIDGAPLSPEMKRELLALFGVQA